MMPIPSGVQVWLTTGHIDMRKGFDGLALLVQETLKRNGGASIVLCKAQVELQRRAETLTVDEWARIVQAME